MDFTSFVSSFNSYDSSLVECVVGGYRYIFESVDDLGSYLESQKAVFAEIAQREYDLWGEAELGDRISFLDRYAGGGICHIIAERIADHINKNRDLVAATVSSDREQHVYVAVRMGGVESENFDVYTVDIPWDVYEEGGGFQWTRLPDVEITDYDVEIRGMVMDESEWNYLIGNEH
jgi:hypothetical protein